MEILATFHHFQLEKSLLFNLPLTQSEESVLRNMEQQAHCVHHQLPRSNTAVQNLTLNNHMNNFPLPLLFPQSKQWLSEGVLRM